MIGWRNKGEQEKREQKRGVAEVFFDLADVMMLVLDATGKVVMINAKGAQLLGLKPAEIIGRDWFESFIPELYREEVRKTFRELMAGEVEPVEFFENPVIDREGKEHLIAWHNALLTEDGGSITGTISSGEDITERRQNEEELEMYAKRLSLLHEIGLSLNVETNVNSLLKIILKAAADLTSAGVGAMLRVNEGVVELVDIHYANWYEPRCSADLDTSRLHNRIRRLISERNVARIPGYGRGRTENVMLPEGHVPLRGLLIGVISGPRGQHKGYFLLSQKAGNLEFTSQDEDIISLLASESSVAINSAENFEREHFVSDRLQSMLLPEAPLREDLEVGLLYRPARSQARVGGDFYDIVELDENRVAVIVGDISGKGLEAATYTAMIKYMLRAYLGELLDPGSCLTRLNAGIMSQIANDNFITAFLGIVDTKNRSMEYASAGHPPPLLCSPKGVSPLHVEVSVPLGVIENQTYPSSHMSIIDTNRIVLYTDGLIEARAEGKPLGIERISNEISNRCSKTPQAIAQHLMEVATAYSEEEVKDDIALLIVGLTGRPSHS